jgi:antitoxin (DNA-binding transcriptional repressor) of toxin-antitoxin stability system
MKRLMLKDIQNDFAGVVANLHPGEVVQIILGDKVVARLIGESESLNQEVFATQPVRRSRQPGSAIGTLTILADDDEHLQDFADYMQ